MLISLVQRVSVVTPLPAAITPPLPPIASLIAFCCSGVNSGDLHEDDAVFLRCRRVRDAELVERRRELLRLQRVQYPVRPHLVIE